MKILAIIPARGGSKRIPGKNLVKLGGKPLLVHSIEQVKATPEIDRLVVSTDDHDIARVALESGAEVMMRPAEISGDHASSESALIHALDSLKHKDGYEPDLIVFVQATSPLRSAATLSSAIGQFVREGADSMFSSCRLPGYVWRKEPDGWRSLNYDYHKRGRHQDTPLDVMENGSFFIFKPWLLRENNNRLGGKITTFIMPVTESFELDDPSDLSLLEHMLAARRTDHPAIDWKAIKLLAMDFDGVMTDNLVQVNQEGVESVSCNRSDGLGIGFLAKAGLDLVVISTEENPVVGARCRKLKLACIQGCSNKREALRELAVQKNLTPDQIAFVGNDVNDREVMAWVGLPIAVADAVPEILSIAKYVTRHNGGRGAIREVAERIIDERPQTVDHRP